MRGDRIKQDRRKWVTQYMLCSGKRFESSKPGRTGRDKGCHVDLGIFRTVLLLCFRPLWVRCIKGKYVSGLDYRHNPSDHPATRHPAQPSLNRRLRWEVEDWVWADRRAGKRETEAKRGVEEEWMDEQTEEWKCERVKAWAKDKRQKRTDRNGLNHFQRSQTV